MIFLHLMNLGSTFELLYLDTEKKTDEQGFSGYEAQLFKSFSFGK